MTRSFFWMFVASCILFFNASSSHAQLFNATLSTGYSNIRTQRSDNLFYTHDGSYLDADFAWRLPTILPVYAGFGVGGSGYYDRQRLPGTSGTGFDYSFDRLYSDFGTFEIEPRLAMRLGARHGLFLEPRIGAGLQVSSYGVDQLVNSNGNTFIDTVYHTGAAFEVHPAVQLGYNWGWGAAGVEGSYLYSAGNFGGFGRHAEEYRIGAFFRFSL